MHDIDFLPADYRQTRQRRQSQPWRWVVVAGFVVPVVAATLGQRHRRRQIEAELAAMLPQRELAERQNVQLGGLQADLARVRARAELITYLRHP